MSEFINKGFDKAVALLNAADEDMRRLPHEVQIFLHVYSTQGVIDNGGYCYFFEADWPDNPPYSVMIEAYRCIGCATQAKELQRVVDTFPFPDPHLHCEQRNEFIDDHWNEDKCCVEIWADELCGDEEVWRSLEEYYLRHQDKFA